VRFPSVVGKSEILTLSAEIRVLDHYAVIGTEITNHHIQIFDLEKLLTITAAQKPKTFSNTADITALWKGYECFLGREPRV
jgi:hypothetical protein